MNNRKQRGVYSGGLGKRVKDVKPRRNYWGNLYDEDTYNENRNIMSAGNYDYSDYDRNDDHDSYYDLLE